MLPGDFLEGMPHEESLDARREDVRDLWLDGTQLLVEPLGVMGRWKEVVAQARWTHRRVPGDDEVTCRLLRGLLKSGTRAAAREELRLYE